MRKIRVTNHGIGQASEAGISSGDVLSDAAQVHVARHVHVNLPRQKFMVSQPAWANFGMESAYWPMLKDVCGNINMTESEFIESAIKHRPNVSVGAAVQIQIVDYYRNRSGPLSAYRPAIADALHESGPT